MDDSTSGAAGSVERVADAQKSPAELVRYWLNAIDVASKEEEKWRDAADKAVKLYRGETPAPFNILLANVETVVPALYNSTPVPDVRTRHNDPNEPARQTAQLVERALSFGLDQYDFDGSIEEAVRGMQIAGRGITRVRYLPLLDRGGENLVWQEVACENVPWRQFRRGPADCWAKVPWVAFELFLTRDELVRLAGEELGAKAPLDAVDPGLGDRGEREKTPFKKACVWEIWDKDGRQVLFIAPGFADGPLKVEPDPLRLLEFFPIPQPLQAITDTDTLIPVAPYEVYRQQAEELNENARRIIRLTKALKYRGVRASEVSELDLVKDMEDGEFVASAGALSVIGGGRALDDAIWVAPIEKLVVVLRELLVQREQIKQTIYELTGVADILRGSTDPNETLGAQQIKAQWGSLRIQRQQARVQRYCRDLFRLKAEIIAEKFTPQTLAMINGAPVAPEVLQILKSDLRRAYQIDIETDSTVRGDLVRAQQNMTNFLQGSAQFFQTFVPLIQSGALPPQVGQVAIAIYAAFARQFKLGKQAEDAMAKLAQSAEQFPIGQPDPETKAKQQDAEQIARAGMVADVEQKQAQVAKTKVETAAAVVNAQAQQVESAAVASGAMQQGFVQ